MNRFVPALILLAACDAAPEATLTWDIQGLAPLGDALVYEGWIVVDGEPVSTGRFGVNDMGAPEITSFELTAEQAAGATTFVLTLEPATGDDPAPAATKLLGGDLSDGLASLSIAHPAALGDDLLDAGGDFVLATPTSATMDDETQGVWFVDPSGDAPVPSLDLPELPEGWVYEGWVVTEDAPTSTGRFAAVDAADDDGPGLDAGPEDAPPFPGQDFVSPPMDLVGATVVISVEPVPDDSHAPFLLKPLLGEAMDVMGVQALDNAAVDSNPTGTVRLQ